MAISEIAEIYRSCKKLSDINWFTEWICRPPAAIVVYLLQNTRVTPNQVSFFSFFLGLIAAGIFACGLSYPSLLWAAGIFHLSFIFDCADGMLARSRKIASNLGHLLDFLLDEIKAMLIFAAVSIRLWQSHHDDMFLLYGMGGLLALSIGLTLTSFMRRQEYSGKALDQEGQAAVIAQVKPPLTASINIIERAARLVVHYPQYLWICALLDRIDIYFWAYAAVNLLYIGRSGLAILWRLGRFQ